MNEQIFPPSPNWYLSNILTCISNDTIAYGSRGNIVVLKKPKESNGEISIISNAHKERVSAVIFSTCRDPEDKLFNCLVSAGDDSYVRVWDLRTLTPILAHLAHGENQKVVGLDWSQADPKFVVSVDEASSIICWDLHRNSTVRVYVGKIQPTCLACCPHKRELIAIGTKAGLVCIVNIKGVGKINYRLRGHDSEVVSLSWCPVKNNVFQKEGNENDLLLASGSKQRSVYIWRAGGDGRYEAVLNISSQLAGIQNRQTPTEGSWVSLCWTQPHLLLAGTKSGRLISWDLKNFQLNRVKPKDGSSDADTLPVCRLLHSSHSRVLYCITSPRQLDIEGNWREHEESVIVWTISQDRLLVAYDISSNEVVSTIPTVGGIIYCIAASPIDANRVAFGAGDAVVRVWDLSSSNAFEVVCLWQKIKGKITTLAWHPTKENWLAFGTAEGRVGLFDVSSSKQIPVLFRPYHCHSLYTLCWGPPLFAKDGDSETKYVLYSCGDGTIVQYNHNKPESEPLNIKDLSHFSNPGKKKEARCDLAWKSDNSMVAIGNDDGTVQVYSPQLAKILCVLYAHKKLIHKLAWHPEGTATDAGYSPYQHWLAVASKDTMIKVYDLSAVAEGVAESADQVQCVATLTGHLSGILCVCWSPHISGQLVSVSYDETAQVWDVPSQLPVGNYSLHSGIVYSCSWSPLDPDLIMTGSADFTLRVWRVSKLTNKLPVDKKKQRKTESKNVKPPEVAECKSDLTVTKEDFVASKPVTDDVEESNATAEIATSEKGEGCSKKKSARGRSFFPVSSKAWMQGRKLSLEHCQNILTTDGHTGPSFFKDRSALMQLLEQEEQFHTASGNAEYVQHMALWKGNLGDTLKEAARKKQLSDWLVSLAPMVSQRLWQETCLAYAEQLSRDCNYHKAASYLLACHKVDEAIELLTSHKLFREAISIAKCRLSPEDPSIDKIIKEWVNQLSSDGQFELAAECLVSYGELEAAAELLGRRNDEGSLRLAMAIAKQAGKLEMASKLGLQCIYTSLMNKNWDLANQVVEEHEDLRHFGVLVSTHKIILELVKENKKPDAPLLTLIDQKVKESYKGDSEEAYLLLEKSIEKVPVHDSSCKLWLSVSGDLSLGSCSKSVATQLRHVVTAALSCYQYQILRPNINPLYKFLMWLAPGDPLQEGSIFRQESDVKEEADLLKSLRCYLFAGFFRWLQDVKMNPAAMNGSVENENPPGDSEGDWVDIAVAVLTEYSLSIEKDVDTMLYYRDQLEIKNCEQEVATAMAKGRLSEAGADEDVALGLQKLERLKKRKELFEKQRLCAPNPFVTYCLFKSACCYLINEKDLSFVEDILKEAETSWKKVESSISEL
ncbi:gem-associated protein 5 [Anabrus simplex]|uniref:gem-associated protein 5 n=1 Tax=Anabrus simplex TaxID=316456 RepID=UPI0034DD4694